MQGEGKNITRDEPEIFFLSRCWVMVLCAEMGKAGEERVCDRKSTLAVFSLKGLQDLQVKAVRMR